MILFSDVHRAHRVFAREKYRCESDAVQEGLDGVNLLQPRSQDDRDARLAELLQLVPPFDRQGRQCDKGLTRDTCT